MFPTQPQRPGPPAVPASQTPAASPPPPGAGAPPTPAPIPQPAGGAPQQGGGMPAQIQKFVDPNNPVQAALIQRMQSMTAQDSATLVSGVSPQALQVLKKMIPDIGFVWDAIAQKQQGGGAGAAAPDAQPPQPDAGTPSAPGNGGGPVQPPQPASPGGPAGPRPAMPSSRLSSM